MGFGWFLIGYFFVSVVSVYSPLSFMMLAGYPVMVYGLWQLAPYHRYLRVSFFFSLLSLPFAIYYAFYGLGAMGLGTFAFVNAAFATVEWIYFVFTLLFTAFWLFALYSLCRELGHCRLLACALRSLIFFAMAQIFDFVARLPIGAAAPYFALPAILLRVITIFLNLYFIYLCYRYICPQGEEFSHLSADAHFKKMKDTLKENKK